MPDDKKVSLLGQTRNRQSFALSVDILALILFTFIADRVELTGQNTSLVIFLVFLIKVYFRFVTEREIVSQYGLYSTVREMGYDVSSLEDETRNIIRDLVFEVSFVTGTALLYLTVIMIMWWVVPMGICPKIAPGELVTRALLLSLSMWVLLEIPSWSLPHLMPWFRTSRLIILYKILFGMNIMRPKGQQQMYSSRSWALCMLVMAIIATLCLLLRGVCASALVSFIGSIYLGLVLFRMEGMRCILILSQSRLRNR